MSQVRRLLPAVAAIVLALAAPVDAQTLSGAKAEPASARTGQPITLTASFANADNPNCGAFSCNAKAGTAAPQPQLECPGALTYFHNVRRGQLGCRP